MAHLDPITNELVPCKSYFPGPISWAKSLRRLMITNHLNEEQIAERTNIDIYKIKRALWLLNLSSKERLDELIDIFFKELDLPNSEKLKSIFKEIIDEINK